MRRARIGRGRQVSLLRFDGLFGSVSTKTPVSAPVSRFVQVVRVAIFFFQVPRMILIFNDGSYEDLKVRSHALHSGT